MIGLPINTIAIWHSSIGSIPPGWHHCDGTNGTPDLRDRFPIGAGDSFTPNDSAGNQDHTHDFLSDGHTHSFPAGALMGAGVDFTATPDINFVAGTTDPASVLPPYFSLPYIMRI